MNTVIRNIKMYRKEKNMTQEDLAKKSNLHRTTIGDIERGDSSPNLDNIFSIANALNTEVHELFIDYSSRQSIKLHQPFTGTLGEEIIKQLELNLYNRFSIIVAYAKKSGVSRILPSMKIFKENGGQIRAFIGIDQMNTSYEALLELFEICDELYIIHNENMSHTYHSKIYMLDNNTTEPNKVWLAIGSNNLTAGGLFINYESCNIDLLNIYNTNDKKGYTDTCDLFDYYSKEENQLSLSITSKITLDNLTSNEYLRSESELNNSRVNQTGNKNRVKMFGQQSIKIPIITRLVTPSLELTNKNTSISNQIRNKDYLTDSNITESFWFEMRKSTGGSRNILDLSSTAKIRAGSVKNTKYYIADDDIIHGGVTFFDVNANNHLAIKSVSITFMENEYYPSTILYTENNQSWRMQLKGESPTDNWALSKYGKNHFMNNILIFHKINSSHYMLEVVDSSYLDTLKSESIFVATNGTPKNSKSFGKLK